MSSLHYKTPEAKAHEILEKYLGTEQLLPKIAEAINDAYLEGKMDGEIGLLQEIKSDANPS